VPSASCLAVAIKTGILPLESKVNLVSVRRSNRSPLEEEEEEAHIKRGCTSFGLLSLTTFVLFILVPYISRACDLKSGVLYPHPWYEK